MDTPQWYDTVCETVELWRDSRPLNQISVHGGNHPNDRAGSEYGVLSDVN